MRIPSQDEKIQAILDARMDVARYLDSIGKIDVMSSFTKDDICGLIRASQEGVQASLHRQMCEGFDDQQIPFE